MTRWTLALVLSGAAYGMTLGACAILHVTSPWSLAPLGAIVGFMVYAGTRANAERVAHEARRADEAARHAEERRAADTADANADHPEEPIVPTSP